MKTDGGLKGKKKYENKKNARVPWFSVLTEADRAGTVPETCGELLPLLMAPLLDALHPPPPPPDPARSAPPVNVSVSAPRVRAAVYTFLRVVVSLHPNLAAATESDGGVGSGAADYLRGGGDVPAATLGAAASTLFAAAARAAVAEVAAASGFRGAAAAAASASGVASSATGVEQLYGAAAAAAAKQRLRLLLGAHPNTGAFEDVMRSLPRGHPASLGQPPHASSEGGGGRYGSAGWVASYDSGSGGAAAGAGGGGGGFGPRDFTVGKDSDAAAAALKWLASYARRGFRV